MTPTDNSQVDRSMSVDEQEIEKFDALAHRWWDPDGDFKPLHDINGARLTYISERCTLENSKVIDVGCGGGILTESLAQSGARVTGIDMAGKALSVAKLHALEAGLDIEYASSTAEAYAAAHPGEFQVVTCLEMLEHVADYPSSIEACARLTQPGGHLFFSTINRNPKAYALLVLGAEYVLKLLPRGTHEYQKFIKPSELARAIRDAGLELKDISGMTYNPFSRKAAIGRDTDANYIVHATKPKS